MNIFIFLKLSLLFLFGVGIIFYLYFYAKGLQSIDSLNIPKIDAQKKKRIFFRLAWISLALFILVINVE